MIFNHTPSNFSPTINLAHNHIRPVSNVKYLGIHLDQKLNLNHHTKLVKRKITSRGKLFRSLTYKNKGIKLAAATKIYKTICRPILDYGHTLYLNCRNPALKNIQVAETSALRIITKIRHPTNPLHHPSNEFLYHKTKIFPIRERLQKLSTKFIKNEQNLQLMEPLLIPRDNVLSRHKFPEQTLQEILTSIANEA